MKFIPQTNGSVILEVRSEVYGPNIQLSVDDLHALDVARNFYEEGALYESPAGEVWQLDGVYSGDIIVMTRTEELKMLDTELLKWRKL